MKRIVLILFPFRINNKTLVQSYYFEYYQVKSGFASNTVFYAFQGKSSFIRLGIQGWLYQKQIDNRHSKKGSFYEKR